MKMGVFGTSALQIAGFLEKADVVKQHGDQGAAKIIRGEPGRSAALLPADNQLDQAQRRLQRVGYVVVGRIHGLVFRMAPMEQVCDGIHERVDIPAVSRAKKISVPLLDEAADFGRTREIDLGQVRKRRTVVNGVPRDLAQ